MAKLIASICPDCGKNITVSSSEQDTRCEHCGKRIHLTNHPDPLPDSAKIIAPPLVKIEHARGVHSIRYFWFQPAHIWVFLFSFLCNMIIFLIVFDTLLLVFTEISNRSLPENVVTGIMIIILLGIGILMLGWSIVHLFNQTIIEIGGDQLSIRFAPFPWFGEKSFKTNELTKLICSRHLFDIYDSERVFGGRYAGKTEVLIPYIEHEIYAYQKNSPEDFLLLSNLPSKEAAYFVKHMIEEYTEIES